MEPIQDDPTGTDEGNPDNFIDPGERLVRECLDFLHERNGDDMEGPPWYSPIAALDRLVAERDELVESVEGREELLHTGEAVRDRLLAGIGALVEKWTDRANGLDRGQGWETAKCADELEALTKKDT
jgi:hypothetical protein